MTVFVNSLNYTLVPCTQQSLATHNQKILLLILKNKGGKHGKNPPLAETLLKHQLVIML